MNNEQIPVKVSFGAALKKKQSKSFNEILNEYGNRGELPFLINKRFDSLYFSVQSDENSNIGLQNSETERFIKTHTQFYEKISKPQNQWVLFAQLNGRLIGTVFKMEEGKMATATVVTPVLKKVWANLNQESTQYYNYLSTLEHNLHRAIHPNYQVQHSKVKLSKISSDLLATNLLVKTPTTDVDKSHNTNFINFLRKNKKRNYKLSAYSFLSFNKESISTNRKNVEKFVMSQHNKYAGLKTLKYCNRIKFESKKLPGKQNKVKK